MKRITDIRQVPDAVLDVWRKQWNNKRGFKMFWGNSYYYVSASNKWDLWIWVRSKAAHPLFPRLRGRICIPRIYAKAGVYPPKSQSEKPVTSV
ncbi:MAG: hypothetical protein ACYS1A_18355 [Planctomycetota bacterium]